MDLKLEREKSRRNQEVKLNVAEFNKLKTKDDVYLNVY